MKGMKNGKNLPNSFLQTKTGLTEHCAQSTVFATGAELPISGAKLCINHRASLVFVTVIVVAPSITEDAKGIASFVSATKRQGRVSTCTGAQPDVFVRVSAIRSWINRAIVR